MHEGVPHGGPLVRDAFARLGTPRTEKVPVGLAGAACVIASVSHYGFFDFWTTGQTELWYTMLAVGAITVACALRKP